jgi:chemotaxis protein methyltransferase CheR
MSESLGILTSQQAGLFAELIYEECGFNLNESSRVRLVGSIQRRIEALGLSSVDEYFDFVRRPEERSRELASLLDAVMVCETSFFRNRPQFELLKEVVLPQLIERRRGGQIRAWSAGCSTGEEAYSIAMTVLEGLAMCQAANLSVRVFASDISLSALEVARRGSYRLDQVKGVEPCLLSKYFCRQGDKFVVGERLRRQVVFEHHNLKHGGGPRGLDIIFCRNVMIYFDVGFQQLLVDRFAEALLPGGYLFLGAAESLRGLRSNFRLVHHNRGVAYALRS